MVLRKEMQEEKEVAWKEGVHEEEVVQKEGRGHREEWVAGGIDVAEQV